MTTLVASQTQETAGATAVPRDGMHCSSLPVFTKILEKMEDSCLTTPEDFVDGQNLQNFVAVSRGALLLL